MKNRRVDLILAEVKESDTVLNIGCAGHDFTDKEVWLHRLLWQKAKRVVGIDTSLPDAAEQDQEYNMVKADAETMQLNEEFDIIVAGELIEHLSNPGSFLEHAREHLKSDGRLVLTTPNPWDWVRLTKAVLKVPSTPCQQHLCWYDRETITHLLSHHGFSVDRVEFVPRIPYAGDKGLGLMRGMLERVLSYISIGLYYVGLRQIASSGLYVKCSLIPRAE